MGVMTGARSGTAAWKRATYAAQRSGDSAFSTVHISGFARSRCPANTRPGHHAGVSDSVGALARGDAAATVEHHAGMCMLTSVSDRLATPALESVKSTFYRLAAADAEAATRPRAAAPPMLADAVAVVLVVGARRRSSYKFPRRASTSR